MPGADALLRASDIAARPDLKLGEVMISPSRRRVEGPAGSVQVEPRTMQVFLLLLDAAGKVVTRNELFDEAWGGAMVGDDSLNRAIGKVRKIAAESAPGFFEVETIPRTGYRLVGDILTFLQQQSAEVDPAKSRISRRGALAGGAGLVAAGGLGLWWNDDRKDREFDQVMARGAQLLDYRDGDVTGLFQRAVALRPDDPKALGLFAYAHAIRTESYASTDRQKAATPEIIQQAEEASSEALSLDSNEPNALLAKVVLERSTLDFAGTEDRLRAILAIAPNHVLTMRHLWDFLQCVGRCQDALTLTERAVTLNPLAAGSQFPRAQLLWIVGRAAEADRVIDRARIAWPDHRTVRFAQFTICAFTGRARTALDMLNESSGFSPALQALWRINLVALDQPTAGNVAAARKACLDGAKRRPTLANSATMVMSALGEVDAAFEILRRRYAIPEPSENARSAQPVQPKGSSTAWRFAPWLFTPPLEAVRADARFHYICDQIGLTEYWAKRGIRPDYQLT